MEEVGQGFQWMDREGSGEMLIGVERRGWSGMSKMETEGLECQRRNGNMSG